jgi:UDP-2-acetamido-3-amino-2,3-dideoxy-glucuronate N-acetyltransferase
MNDVFIHPTALVETRQIGPGTKVWAFTHVLDGVSIGSNCNIADHCYIESGVVIGDNVTIKNANMLWEGVRLEDGVFVGPNVVFTNDLFPRSPRIEQARERYASKQWLVPTLVEEGAALGGGAVLIAGVTVGAYALVAAGAIVTKDVPSHALMVGNPARFAGWVCECGEPLPGTDGEAPCRRCGRRFVHTDSGVRLRGE